MSWISSSFSTIKFVEIFVSQASLRCRIKKVISMQCITFRTRVTCKRASIILKKKKSSYNVIIFKVKPWRVLWFIFVINHEFVGLIWDKWSCGLLLQCSLYCCNSILDTPSRSSWDEDDVTPPKKSSWDLPTPLRPDEEKDNWSDRSSDSRHSTRDKGSVRSQFSDRWVVLFLVFIMEKLCLMCMN